MLRLIRHASPASSRLVHAPAASRLSRAASTSAAPDSPLLPKPSDIWVLPFQQKPGLALQRMDIFSTATARSFLGIVAQISKSLLGFSIVTSPIQRTRWSAVYLPAWIWSAKVKGTAKRDASPNGNAARADGAPPGGAMITINLGSGPLLSRQSFDTLPASGEGLPKEVSGTLELQDNFFPGTSLNPLQYINVSVNEQIDRSLDSAVRRYDPAHVPSVFAASDLEELGFETIPAIPFDVSPLAIPEVVRRQPTVQSLPFTVETEDLEWQKLEATPIYLPFYLANYTIEDRDFSLALAATDENIGACDIHFPPPVEIEKNLKWPAKPLRSALHPGSSPLAFFFQSSFVGPIDPEQWLSQKERDAVEADVEDADGPEDDKLKQERAAAYMQQISSAVLAQNIRTDADRWLDSDGVRALLAKTSVTARGNDARGVGRFVPFVKRDEGEFDDEYE